MPRDTPILSVWAYRPILQFSVAALGTVTQALSAIKSENWGFWMLISTRTALNVVSAANPAAGMGSFASSNPMPIICDDTIDPVQFINPSATVAIDVTILARDKIAAS